jgi:outer membrane protein TolC
VSRPALSRPFLVALPLLLSACAGLVEERGFAAVRDQVRETTGQEVAWIRTEDDRKAAAERVDALLAETLTADAAAQVALLNNRGLQAAYHRLGLSAADMVAALTPPNPGFSFSRLKGGGVLELERAVTLDLLGLLALPVAAAIEDRRWEQARLEALDAVLRVATEARVAFHGAVAADQLLAYMEQARESAEASAEMARRLGLAGTYGRLQQAREQVFQAELLVQYARARKARTAARERLARALGLWDMRREVRLPERLPDLPETLPQRTELEAKAIESRIDIRMARLEVEGLARSYGLTQATRFVNVLEAGWHDKRETGSPRARGYEIAITVPIFDFGTTRVAQAEHTYMAAVHRLAEMSVAARSEVRERWRNTASPGTWRSTIAARWCRAARRSPTSSCCATTACWSASSSCWPTPATRSRPWSPPSRPSATGGKRPPHSMPPSSAATRRRAAWPPPSPPAARPAARTDGRPGALQPGRHAERLDAAVAHEQRRKEFHLVAEPVVREIAPGMKAPTCGATTARARARRSSASRATACASSSPTSCRSTPPIHWHGILLPNGMDGVGGLTQPQIKPGKTYVYEFR